MVIYECNQPFSKGSIISRPTRFTISAKMDWGNENIYLPNPGKLSTVIKTGREILCLSKTGKHRKTRFNAFAINLDKFYVTVDSNFANTLFQGIVEKKALKRFESFNIAFKEKNIAGYGRIDFVLKDPKDKLAYVEVKSCTHVKQGIAKFPDRPTERGRRHLQTLSEMASASLLTYVVFIVQRPDARLFRPFKEVDPEFAVILKEANSKGVHIVAMTTEFNLPGKVYLRNGRLKVDI
jgi:sugar fermentation stimulation protein A